MKLTPFVAAVLSAVAAPVALAQLGLPYCASTDNSTGAAATMELDGSGDATRNDLVLRCRSLPIGSPGCFLVGRDRAALPPPAGGVGTLCLGGPTWIDAAHVLRADVHGEVASPFDLLALPATHWPMGVRNGDTLRFQYWYRDHDPAGAATSRFSDARALTFSDGPIFAAQGVGLVEFARKIVAADLDGDGRVDFVGMHTEAARLSIVEGRADGSFALEREVETTTSAADLASGDFDGDGDVDVAVVGFFTDSVVLHWNVGDGRLGPPQRFPGVARPVTAGAGDFDGDGIDDLVVTQQGGGLAYFSSNGSGTLTRRANREMAPRVSRMVVVDIAHDGHLDLVTVHYLTGYLEVRTGLGGGHFVLTGSIPIGPAPGAIAIDDLQGDGYLDIVVSHQSNPHTHAVLVGLPGGGFAPTTHYLLDGGSTALALFDFDHDGRKEIAAPSGHLLRVYWYPPSGPHPPAMIFPFPGERHSLLVHDVDGDGVEDLVSAGGSNVEFSVVHGLGAGGLELPEGIPSGGGNRALAVGDVDGDGVDDVVALNGSSTDGVTLMLTGAGAFPTNHWLPLPGQYHSDVALADLDADGDLDIVTVWPQGAVDIFLNEGAPTFSTLPRLRCGGSPIAVVAEDFDGDGDIDLVVSNSAQQYLSLLVNLGAANFAPSRQFAVGDRTLGRVALDVDRDGLRDLVVSGADGIAWLRSLGGGVFSNAIPLFADSTGLLSASDIDDDGDLDLLAQQSGLVLLRNQGAIGFRLDGAWTTSDTIGSIDVGDVNGDGDLDVLLGGTSTIELMLGTGDGRFPWSRVHFAAEFVREAVFVDLDVDGDLDVVTCGELNLTRNSLLRNRLR
jgi:hypothetical protein